MTSFIIKHSLVINGVGISINNLPMDNNLAIWTMRLYPDTLSLGDGTPSWQTALVCFEAALNRSKWVRLNQETLLLTALET